MNNAHVAHFKKLTIALGLLLLLCVPKLLVGQPTPSATAAFNAYSRAVELRLAAQHSSPAAFLVLPATDPDKVREILRQGEPIIERLSSPADADLSKALLHDWRGTAFASGAKAADFERLMRDFSAYPQHFAPQVVEARLLAQQGDRVQAQMRVRQRHVITVVLDATYDITFGRLDARRGYSVSRSVRVAEIEAAGTRSERPLSDDEEHGFLWRLNTYWSYEERDGGLYLQVEAVSLTHSVPLGLNWAVRPYVESIPRESLDFTLRSVCSALRKQR